MRGSGNATQFLDHRRNSMGEIIQFISKSELERARLIRKARAIYDSIFPPVDPAGEQGDGRQGPETRPDGKN